jgi:hypothetical protein
MKFIQNKLFTAIFAFFMVVPAAFSQETGGPLNLEVLSAKDTASFETYKQRAALLSDSISATHRAMEAIKKKAESAMLALAPKGEFEKQAEFDDRQKKWQTELAQRIEKDSKPLALRLDQLEKAKSKVMDNQASLYGSVDIKTNPSSVSIWIDREEIGASPALYNLLIPGKVKIILRKEGYNPYDTILQVAPGAKLKLNVDMEEKSIFSQENEINFVKILKQDTTMQGYEARIKIIEARKLQVDEEIKAILMSFPDTYPSLEAQRQGESSEAFKKRHDAWSKEGMRQYGELQKKHEAYKAKLDRSIAVLKDHIVAAQSSVVAVSVPGAKMELGAYDADKEVFELVAQDTASEKSPFLFKGKVAISRDAAVNVNRSAPGFVAGVQYINYPFKTNSISVNLAMSKLSLSNNGQHLNVEGSFGEIERYKTMDGYGAWKLYADSLLSGTLKPQGLDYNYAMGRNAAKAAATMAAESAKEEEKAKGLGLGWRGWTRIVAFTAAAGLGGAAVYKHSKDDKNQRNIFAGAAGGCALVGVVTFIL